MAAVEAAGQAPDYEAAELYTRAFHLGTLGRCWRQQLGPADLSLAAEAAAAEAAEAAVAAELGCAEETVAELRAVCRWRPGRRAGGGGALLAGLLSPRKGWNHLVSPGGDLRP